MTASVERQIQRFAEASPGATEPDKRRAGIAAWSPWSAPWCWRASSTMRSCRRKFLRRRGHR
ncbi:MAG: hypothetical protein WDN48_17170 [Pseudolabrys sp.]